jgi:tungstate transport system ATP-binding protein
MSDVILNGVSRIIDRKAILKEVNLKVNSGDIMAILGPSGAGKTTMLRLINLLDRPNAGSIHINGKDVTSNGGLDVRRSMAMVMQKPVVFSMSVYKNIAFGLEIRHERKDEIDKRINDVLCLLDMCGRERQHARELSGGEAQRVAFARAYVLKPRLLLLDEPTASLDPSNVAIIEGAIKDINKKYGTTVIIITHNLYQAKRLSNKAAFMLDGELIEAGNIKKIFESPEDQKTKDFISGNMIF